MHVVTFLGWVRAVKLRFSWSTAPFHMWRLGEGRGGGSSGFNFSDAQSKNTITCLVEKCYNFIMHCANILQTSTHWCKFNISSYLDICHVLLNKFPIKIQTFENLLHTFKFLSCKRLHIINSCRSTVSIQILLKHFQYLQITVESRHILVPYELSKVVQINSVSKDWKTLYLKTLLC